MRLRARIRIAAGVAVFSGLLSVATRAATLPDSVGQVVVGIAEGWDATSGTLQCFERSDPSAPWRPVVFAKPIPVLYGKGGLAWGRGLLVAPQPGQPVKREGDRKSPAGVFRIGRVFGYAPRLPQGSSPEYPYRQVGKWDAWSDDPDNPFYNQHVVVDPNNVPPWFDEAKMRHGDFAYEWLLEIRHNADPPVPGAGSAMFFHIRRGPDRRTFGCTTMEKSNLEAMIRWLRPGAAPHYILLPRGEYQMLAKTWGLP